MGVSGGGGGVRAVGLSGQGVHLVLDAGDQFAVGAGEALHAFALQLGGDAVQVEAGGAERRVGAVVGGVGRLSLGWSPVPRRS